MISTWQICKIADGVRIIGSREYASVISALLTGLNSSGGVIIVTNASRFERVEDRKRAGVVGALLAFRARCWRGFRRGRAVRIVAECQECRNSVLAEL